MKTVLDTLLKDLKSRIALGVFILSAGTLAITNTRDAFFIGTEYEQKFNYLMVIWIIFWAKTTYDVGYKSFVDEKKAEGGGGGDEGDGHGGKSSRKTREAASGGARRRSTRRT